MSVKCKKIGNASEEDRLMNELCVTPLREGFLEIGDDKFVLPIYYEEYREKINALELKDDDVFIVGHPKSGTTWLQEMVFLILGQMSEDARKVPITEHTVILDFPIIFNAKKMAEKYGNLGLFDSIGNMRSLKSPRLIKTHLNWPLLPEQIRNGIKTPKIIYICRNPKDVCVSYYYHALNIDGFRGGFEDFCKLFLAGKITFGPFFASVKSYYDQRGRANILILSYVEMKRNLAAVIGTISQFLERSLSEPQIAQLAEEMTFEAMKKSKRDVVDKGLRIYDAFYEPVEKNSFFRVGESGSHKNEMSKELIAKFDEWTAENIAGTGIAFEDFVD